jgi:hypothetical protein
MLELCLRTLRSSAGSGAEGAVAVPVTLHTAAAVRGALDAYMVTVAAAKTLLGAVLADDERAAFGEWMVGYGRARGARERVAGDLLEAAGGCDNEQRTAAARIKAGYTAGLRGMNGCRTASPAPTAATPSRASNSSAARSLKLLLLQRNDGHRFSGRAQQSKLLPLRFNPIAHQSGLRARPPASYGRRRSPPQRHYRLLPICIHGSVARTGGSRPSAIPHPEIQSWTRAGF